MALQISPQRSIAAISAQILAASSEAIADTTQLHGFANSVFCGRTGRSMKARLNWATCDDASLCMIGRWSFYKLHEGGMQRLDWPWPARRCNLARCQRRHCHCFDVGSTHYRRSRGSPRGAWNCQRQNPRRRRYSRNRQADNRRTETTIREGALKLAHSSWLAS